MGRTDITINTIAPLILIYIHITKGEICLTIVKTLKPMQFYLWTNRNIINERNIYWTTINKTILHRICCATINTIMQSDTTYAGAS